MTKTALKTNFFTWDWAEILGKSSSYIEEDFPKISASSYVEKVAFESYFSFVLRQQQISDMSSLKQL